MESGYRAGNGSGENKRHLVRDESAADRHKRIDFDRWHAWISFVGSKSPGTAQKWRSLPKRECERLAMTTVLPGEEMERVAKMIEDG